MITQLNEPDKSQVATSSPDDSPATAPPSAPAAVPAPAEAVEVEREVKPDPIEAVKIQTVSDPAAVVSEVVKHTNTAVAVARNGTTTVANRKLSANLKFLAFQLLRLLFSPITVPVWIIWKSCSTTVTLISRLYLSFHAMLFETDPDKFERVLLHSIHRMEGTMRQMNSSLTNAGQKVEQQMAHVTRLEGLWQLEHERLLAAREERRSTESEFQKASREFSHELASAKKAAADAEELHASEFQRASREFMNDLASAKKAAADAAEVHAEALRSARAEMQIMLEESQEVIKSDVSRIECVLNASKCAVRGLQDELQEAREAGSKASQEIKQLQLEGIRMEEEFKDAKSEIGRVNAELHVSRAEAAALQQQMDSTHAVLEKQTDALEALRQMNSLSATAGTADADAANSNTPEQSSRFRSSWVQQINSPGSHKLNLQKSTEIEEDEDEENMRGNMNLKDQPLASHFLSKEAGAMLEKDASFVSDDRDSVQDSPALKDSANNLSSSLLASHSLPGATQDTTNSSSHALSEDVARCFSGIKAGKDKGEDTATPQKDVHRIAFAV